MSKMHRLLHRILYMHVTVFLSLTFPTGISNLVDAQLLPNSLRNITITSAPSGPTTDTYTQTTDGSNLQLQLTAINIYEQCDTDGHQPTESTPRRPPRQRRQLATPSRGGRNEETLWDQIDSETCNLTTSNDSIVTAHGNQHHTCRYSATNSSEMNAVLEIMNAHIQSELTLTIEFFGNQINLRDKYVLIDTQSSACAIRLHQTHFQLTMRGNGSVRIIQDSSTNVSATSECIMKEYNMALSCTETDPCTWPHVCSLALNSTCVATLGFREIELDCNDKFESDSFLILYPDYMQELNLQANQIRHIIEGAFVGLPYLEILSLAENKLQMLAANVFEGLDVLEELDLSVNQLYNLDASVFQSLSNLRILTLTGNQLFHLPSGLFSGLGNMVELYLGNNKIDQIPEDAFHGLTQLTRLDMRMNSLASLPPTLFNKHTQLVWLNLQDNDLATFPDNIFANLTQLDWLQLGRNSLTELKASWLRPLQNLKAFHCGGNLITRLDGDTFKGLRKIEKINLYSNLLTNVDFNAFKDMPNLGLLSLDGNRLHTIPFVPVLSLRSLLITNNPLTRLSKNSLLSLPDDVFFSGDQPEICECYAPPNITCTAAEGRSPYLTCERLLSNRVIVVLMWIIGINALVGNAFVLIFKQRNKKKSKAKIQDSFLSNLAIADILMGVYMIIMASADIYFGEYFPMQAEKWRSGIMCKITGAIAIISSEASILFLLLITLNRFLNIRFPFSIVRFNKLTTNVTILLTWIFALSLGIIPSALAGGNYKFYDNSHVCVGLPLALIPTYSYEIVQIQLEAKGVPRRVTYSHFHGYEVGNYFANAIFLGLNGLCCLLIMTCYVDILRFVKESRRKSGRTKEASQEIQLTAKVAAIVTTDLLGWFPVIILGIIVQLRVDTLPPSVFAWMVSVVLPLNSAINPYLYTLGDIIAKYRAQDENSSGTKLKGMSNS